MKIKLNSKGFTLVEILAAIVIMGILMGTAIGAISYILAKSKTSFYENLENQLILAAKSYYTSHQTLLPQNIGQKRQVSIETLIKNNYLKRGDVVDYGKAECDTEESYVRVIKYSKKDYFYTIYLQCPAYSIDEEKKIKDINVSVAIPSADDISTAKTVIEMSVDESINQIASYQYIIYKNDQVIYTSNNISGDNQSFITRNVKLKKYVPGTIKVVVTVYDIYGNVKSASTSSSIYDKGLPKCGSQSPSLDLQNNNQWINSSSSTKSRKITVKCINSKTKCLSSSFSRTFSSDIDESYVTILGKNNEEVNCPVNVMIDKTKPSCGTRSDSTTWTNNDRTVSVSCKDVTSGCVKSSYSELFDNSNTQNKVVKTKNITIKDKAGNSNTCPMNVYVDKQKPTCTVSGGSTSWTGENRTVTVNCDDGSGSGCKVSSFKDTITTTMKTKTYTVEDHAGNKGTCTADIYVDKTAPTCSTSGGSTNWTSGNRTIKVNCSDSSGSGCKQPSFDDKVTSTTKTKTYIVEDKVGNKNSCQANVYVDKDAPKCGNISGSSTSWTNKNRTIKVNCSDGSGSGCTASTFSKTFSNNGKTDTIQIKDKVGRTTNCIVNKYIDKTPPYTPIANWTKISNIGGYQIQNGLYGDCVGSNCGGGNYSLTLQQQGKVCFTNWQCNVNAQSKISSSRSCAYRKTTSCGEPWPAETAGDEGGSGINRLESTTVNKLCKFQWQGGNYYIVWGFAYYAVDNAGNRSQPLYVWELMNDVYSENLLNYFRYNNGSWELKSGMSCPTQWPLL